MKALYLTIGLILITSNAFAEMRTWTAAESGQTFVGELISQSSKTVTLKSPSGKTIKVPIAGLSKEDQDYIAFHRPVKLEISMDLTTPETGSVFKCCPRIRLKNLGNQTIEKQLDLYALVFDESGNFLAGTCRKDIRFSSDRRSEPIILNKASFMEKQYADMLVMLTDSSDNIVAFEGTSKFFDDPHQRAQLLNQAMCYMLLQKTSADPSDAAPEAGLAGQVYDLNLLPNGRTLALDPEKYKNIIKSLPADRNRLRKYFRSPQTITSTAFIWPTMGIPQVLDFLGYDDNENNSFYYEGRVLSFRGVITPAETITLRWVSRGSGQILIGMKAQHLDPFTSHRSAGKPQPSVFPFGSNMTVHGDWVTLEKGEAVGIEIIVAPTANAVADALLFVEVKGETYDSDATGAPILPLFATAELSEDFLRHFYNGMQPGMEPLDPVIFKVEQKQAGNR